MSAPLTESEKALEAMGDAVDELQQMCYKAAGFINAFGDIVCGATGDLTKVKLSERDRMKLGGMQMLGEDVANLLLAASERADQAHVNLHRALAKGKIATAPGGAKDGALNAGRPGLN